MEPITLKVKKLREDAVIPSQAMDGDVGLDLTAVEISYDAYGNLVAHTGIAIEIPEGYCGVLRARSSIRKKALVLSNGVGTIENTYRGELLCIFKPVPLFTQNIDEDKIKDNHTFEVGDRVAQLVITPQINVITTPVLNLSDTERGDGGFGSTGK